MLEWLVVLAVAFGASLLTLFSGFGLGTLLLPAFAVFFPIEFAVAATAAVHLANNLFKFGLLGRDARWRVVALFGLPAVPAALAGALLLGWTARLPALAQYDLAGTAHRVEAAKLLVASLMVCFAVLELLPRTRKFEFSERWLPLGGALSGFFGGVSGHQGALRSAFLVRLGLGPTQFVATGVACALLIDLARLPVYGANFSLAEFEGRWPLLTGAMLSAFAGAAIGARFLKSSTLEGIRYLVAALLLLVAALLGLGLV